MSKAQPLPADIPGLEERVLAEAFTDYTQRIHSSIGYVTPAEFATQWEMRNK